MSRLIFLFVDGFGAGKNDEVNNPFFIYRLNFFEKFFGGQPYEGNLPMVSVDKRILLKGIDARMEIEGLPQSGTGQTSILCGVNASEIVGQHFGPFPHTTLLPFLEKESIISDFLRAGKRVHFMNAYPQVFFDYINAGKKRLGAFAMSAMLNGLRLNGVDEVLAGDALTAEITGERWNIHLGYKLPLITPEAAAERLLRKSAENDLLIYEYFLTDHIGHGRIKDEAEKLVRMFDRFITAIFTGFNDADTTVFMCSDHGNFEDLSVKSHTLNPALMIAAGKHKEELSARIKSLPDIKPALTNLFL
ncbi:MAG: alkaline phosphatase family protein [Ignavibacteriaceae bacterium]|nr:alkaline phosphatase family protein [Ignavibacteriaceae bacterium]